MVFFSCFLKWLIVELNLPEFEKVMLGLPKFEKSNKMEVSFNEVWNQ
jgi:hypothetical protein